MPTALIIAGIAGRMGQRIHALAAQEPQVKVMYGLESPDRKVSLDVPVGCDRSQIAKADVVIDFSSPEAAVQLAPEVARRGKALVLGTTGFTAEQEKKILEVAQKIPVVKSSNMSLGVNVFFRAAEQLARALPNYAVHIQEKHHAHKKDAPSGTALQVGRLIEKVTGKAVTYESFREGEVVGDHRVILKGPADQIELLHHADSRDIFAAGALQAAQWIVGKKPGLYSMADVLGL